MPLKDIEILARLERFGAEGGKLPGIGEAALLLAHLDLPENNLADYLADLDLIAADLSDASHGADTLPDQITALTETLYKRHGYHGDGDSYDDPQNANLMRVMDRRKGLPVALGILVLHVGRAQGWDITGLNFPGHFVLRLTKSGEHALIDPFDDARLLLNEDLQDLLAGVHGARVKLQPAFIRSVSDQDILIRLQNNIKTRALQGGERKRALEILISMNLIAPTNVDVLAELAALESSEGNYQSALGRLDLFLERNPETTSADDIINLKKNLKNRLN